MSRKSVAPKKGSARRGEPLVFDDDEGNPRSLFATDSSAPMANGIDGDAFEAGDEAADPEALALAAFSCSWDGDREAAALLWAVARYLRMKESGVEHLSELSALKRASAALDVRARGQRAKSPATHAFEQIVDLVNVAREACRPEDEIVESALNDAWLFVHDDDCPPFAQRQAARAEARTMIRRAKGVCDAESFARACLKAVGVARPDNAKSAAHGKRALRKRRRS